MGSGAPAVVFDQGWGDWSPAWAVVQPQVATFTRACSYDRAGYGFSEPGPMPRTSVRVADELHAALHNAGISPPYILVAAAFGSYGMRVFADRYMPEVAGIVLSDADDGDVEPAKWQARDRNDIPRLVAEMRRCRDAIASRSPLPARCPRNFFRGLPEQTFSRELNATLLNEIQTQTAPYDAAISEMEEMPDDWSYLQQHGRSFGSRPVRVLTTWHFGRPPQSPPTFVANGLHSSAIRHVHRLRGFVSRPTHAKSSITVNTGITSSSITRRSSLRQFAMCSRRYFGLTVPVTVQRRRRR